MELEGTDSIGARLGMRLKEAFNGSNLFSLTDKDMPKMRLLVSTQSEFPGRPGVGSVYSICWTFTQGEGYLGYLLAREVGTLTYEGDRRPGQPAGGAHRRSLGQVQQPLEVVFLGKDRSAQLKKPLSPWGRRLFMAGHARGKMC